MNTQAHYISFGITGKEFQSSFDPEKYVALAHQQPRGILLQQQVEYHWEEWCRIVAGAPWLSYWKMSSAIRQQCVTPADLCCLEPGCGNVPLTIFGAAVWGFGVEGWLTKRGRAARSPLNEILRLQEVKAPNKNRTYMWDDKLYRDCGILMPSEFGDLDRWLEPMWHQVCSRSRSLSSK